MVYKKLKCMKCKYEWYPKNPELPPKVCPVCKSRDYNKVKTIASNKKHVNSKMV